ncbi:hypothetical protein GUJ93_ZPchr0005g15558 [Zizania palustris]|uniref:Uncharacterized protein n=1 Tax=Zizania palustris TaxID=103762 RepID=A0A8J5VFV4_ZIZPA|nr:hypothetical protein GUJ93_ZPchr0005g15558 [Zizania palustris]
MVRALLASLSVRLIVMALSSFSFLTSSAPACSRGFLWMSQRSAEDARLDDDRAGLLLLLLLLLPLRFNLLEEEEEGVLLLLTLVLLLSQRSHASAREMLLPPFGARRSVGGGGTDTPQALVLCASYLSTESARPGLGLEGDEEEVGRMVRHRVWIEGASISLLGGVGSRAGRAALARDCCRRSMSIEQRQIRTARRAVNDRTRNWWTAPWRRHAYLWPQGSMIPIHTGSRRSYADG